MRNEKKQIVGAIYSCLVSQGCCSSPSLFFIPLRSIKKREGEEQQPCETGHVIISLIFFSYSCSDDFLDKTYPTKTDSSKFYSNVKEIDQAVSGIYSQLQGIIGEQWLFNEMITDNTTVDLNINDSGQVDRMEAMEFFTYNNAHWQINGMYGYYYNAIYNINNTLSKIEKASIADEYKNPYIGQIKFLRAYYYFELTQYFGDVIVITEPLSVPSDAWKYIRIPQIEVYKQIELDLKNATEVLPVSYDSKNVGRVTKGAALSLLGKVYLTQKKYSDAVVTLTEVTKLGYALTPSYENLFKPENKNGIESIFEVQFQGGNDLGEWSGFIYTFAPRDSKGAVTGWPQSNPGGWNMPTKNIIAAYELGDTRKDASVGLDYFREKTKETIPYIKKYDHTHAIYGRTDDNWSVLRYADVLLMLAEAINEESGPITVAYDYINKIRNRAGLADLSTGLDKNLFREKVLKERRVELAFENWRWFDLKRTMTATELTSFMNQYGLLEKADPTISRQGLPYSNFDYVFQEYRILFPIPAEEIRLNSKLTQNTGY